MTDRPTSRLGGALAIESRWLRRIAFCAGLGLAATTPRPAAAADKAAAEALFLEGKALMDAGDLAQACERFAASMRAEPSVGAQLNLALCNEQRGKLATAWSLYRDAAVLAESLDDDRRAGAEARATALKPQVPRLTVVLVGDTPGVRVTRNGEEVVAFDTPLPTDPGRYRIEASAPGRAAWSTSVTLEPRGEARVLVPALDPLGDEPGGATPAGEQPLWQVVTGWSLVGVGGLGLAVGIGFGAAAAANERDLAKRCNPDKTCPDDVLDDLSAARTRADVSTAMLVVGGAAAAAGVVLLLLPPLGEEAQALRLYPTFGPQQAGLGLMGRF
ncbi:MAG: hypothetical protein R3B72_15645 [Polyangiaceae bacterium]